MYVQIGIIERRKKRSTGRYRRRHGPMLVCVACGNGLWRRKMRTANSRRGVVLMLNENIRALRKAKGLSQGELAIKLNVVRQTVSKWEQGRSVPDADMLIVLSEALGVPASTLLGETVPEAAP